VAAQRRVATLAAIAGVALLVAAPLAAPVTAMAQPAPGGEPVEGPLGQATLPDARAYEHVSPREKNGYSAGALSGAANGGSGAAEPLLSRAAESGEAFFYQATGPFGEAVGGQNPAQLLAHRDAEGWSTATAGPTPLTGPTASGLGEPTMISEDLGRLLFVDPAKYTADDVAFSRPEFEHKSANVFLYGVGPGATSWLGRPQILEPIPMPGEVKELPKIIGGSPDLGVAYFSYYGTLLPEDSTRAAVIAQRSEPQTPEPLSAHAWGLYEYRDGAVKLASILPDGTPAAEGALAAASGGEGASDYTQTAGTAAHVVSHDASRVFFVSPDPRGSGGEQTQLYMRETPASGVSHSILISRSTLTGLPAQGGVLSAAAPAPSSTGNVSYVYATPDGSRAFFQTTDRLTSDAPEEVTFPKAYEYDLATGALTYLPGLSNSVASQAVSFNTSTILASSADGTTLLVLKGGKQYGPEAQLAVYSRGQAQTIAPLPVKPPAQLTLEVAPVRALPDGSRFVFQTNAPIPGFNNGEGANTEVYTYTSPSPTLPDGELACLSCPPGGATPSGNSLLSNLVAEGESGRGENEASVTEGRGVSDDLERVFFSTPDALVAGDINAERDVYEWEAAGVGSCPAAESGGCRFLISSGLGSQPSFLLDNSASGDDVFFATADALDARDGDGAYDVYDARAPHAPGEVVGFPAAVGPAGCNGASCQPSAPSGTPPSLLTALAGPTGNLAPPPTASVSAKLKRKPLTRTQKLARALAACRKKPRHARAACQKRAHRLYGAIKHSRRHTR
jgi:hypothetical protein